MLAAPSLGGPCVSTEKHASPSPSGCCAASSLRVVLARPMPAMLATPAMLERGLGLEQGRYVDLVGDPEQPREVKGSEHRRRLFAFGNQHADRRVGVDDRPLL